MASRPTMGNTQASSSPASGETALASADELQAKIFLALSTIAETSKTLKTKYGDEADPRVLSFVDDIGAHLPKSVGALEYARDAIKDMPVVVQYVDSKGAAEAPITVDTDKLNRHTPSPPLEEGEVCTLTLTVDLDVEDYDERPLHLTFKAEPLADGRLPIPPFTWVVDAKLRQFLIEQDQIQREKRQLAAKKGKGKQREVPEEPMDSRDTLPVTIVIVKPSTAPATTDAPDFLPAHGMSNESTVAPTGGLKFKYSLNEQFYPRFPHVKKDLSLLKTCCELVKSYEHAARGLVFTYQLKEWPIVLETANVDATGQEAAKPRPKKVAKQVKAAQRPGVEPSIKEAPRAVRIALAKAPPATAAPVRRSSRLGSAKAAIKVEDPRQWPGRLLPKERRNRREQETRQEDVDAKKTIDTRKTPAAKTTRKRKAEENGDDVEVDTSVKSTTVPTKKARRATITKKAAPAETAPAEKIPAAKKTRSTKRE
ncbi:hypothetical protein IMY05_C4662000800 [Salix suchowensis]|nr:hypothetical protein IMY05_C4662000800 [Salix suchowensis]